MRRTAFSILVAAMIVTIATAPVYAQSEAEQPPVSSQAPLRPYDPPEAEPVFIPDLVSDLVLTDMGGGLSVSPLSANSPAPTSGSGLLDWAALAEFALPAAIPLLAALVLLGLTRVPRRPSDPASVDNGS